MSATHDRTDHRFESLERAFRELLIEQGVVTQAEIDQRVEALYARAAPRRASSASRSAR